MPPVPDLPDGLVVVVKRSCPVDLRREIAERCDAVIEALAD